MLKPLVAVIATASFLALGACTQETRIEDESSAERSLENAGNEIEQAADNAGDEIQQAGDRAEESVEDATDGNPNTTP